MNHRLALAHLANFINLSAAGSFVEILISTGSSIKPVGCAPRWGAQPIRATFRATFIDGDPLINGLDMFSKHPG